MVFRGSWGPIMKRIVYKGSDDILHIVIPVRNTYPIAEDLTDDQVLQRAISALPPEVVDYSIVDEAAIPTDRANRHAWTFAADKKSVVVDQNKIAAASEPTKEQLMAELAALTAKIQALE